MLEPAQLPTPESLPVCPPIASRADVDRTTSPHHRLDSTPQIPRQKTHSQAARRLAGIRLPPLISPKSQYEGWKPSKRKASEFDGLSELWAESKRLRRLASPPPADGLDTRSDKDEPIDAGFHSFELDSFSIYNLQTPGRPSELTPLHHISKTASSINLFDGILREGDVSLYVESIPFRVVSIGNYCDLDAHGVGDQLWIQSVRGVSATPDFWYHLKDPSPEYRPYHDQFMWLANFAKHFTDFLHVNERVCLRQFREDFHRQLIEYHGEDADFRTWLEEYGDTDFARVTAANVDFLWKEAVDVNETNRRHPIWREIDPKCLKAVKTQRVREEQTIVTPFVYDCFKHLAWGQYLEPTKTSRKVLEARRKREQDLHLTVDSKVGVEIEDSTESTPDETPVPAREDFSIVSASHPKDPVVISDDEDPPRESPSTININQPRPDLSIECLTEFFDEEHTEEQERRAKRNGVEASANRARQVFKGPVLPRPTRLPRDDRGNLLVDRPRHIRVGDVVGVYKDAKTIWKGSADLWYAYVQGSQTTPAGRQYLQVIWLYRPSDTTCSRMRYPFHNELFFSDNCNCYDKKFDAEDVVCRASVALFKGPGESGAEFSVRQHYETTDASFVTLKRSHLTCAHRGAWKTELDLAKEKYKVGDTVLYKTRSVLEPAEIIDFIYDGAKERVVVKTLLRRGRDISEQQDCRPNELVYTNHTRHISPEAIHRKCLVRFYAPEEKANGAIVAPYNRDGTGDAYYITSRQTEDGRLLPLQHPFPPSLIQGFDPRAPPPKDVLHGMDLYCGGGNFGRGLEEGGAVHNRWAVDYDEKAIHTYHANLREPEGTALYYGSVNDFLAHAIRGQNSEYIPAPGEVDFISAGSPCQGFSNINGRKQSEQSLRNCSLVASVAAYVDFYRPKYALLENVVAMASLSEKYQDQNVFSQTICCLVGMGYQVQQFNLDAWSFGSPQSRSRLFISIAAPGLPLPPHPGLSHAHPPGKSDRGLGVASNGVQFGVRRFPPTPFPFTTAAAATRDLPHIGAGRSQTCIPHPDHRFSRIESRLTRAQIAQIPVNPPEQSFITAFQRGWLAAPQIAAYAWDNKLKTRAHSRAWRRVHPRGLMPTVLTSCQPACSFVGTTLHWDQHRLLTIMEARRAQSFPDEDVILGLPSTQWKIVGNSVARSVALALGLSVRKAWLKEGTEEEDEEEGPRVGGEDAVEVTEDEKMDDASETP